MHGWTRLEAAHNHHGRRKLTNWRYGILQRTCVKLIEQIAGIRTAIDYMVVDCIQTCEEQ